MKQPNRNNLMTFLLICLLDWVDLDWLDWVDLDWLDWVALDWLDWIDLDWLDWIYRSRLTVWALFNMEGLVNPNWLGRVNQALLQRHFNV